jgi:hypothetical protein
MNGIFTGIILIDLEVYSDDPYDLSVLPTYDEFIEDYRVNFICLLLATYQFN